ncbi:MAG: AAA family ATPase, partial [Bacteroidia bacterium]
FVFLGIQNIYISMAFKVPSKRNIYKAKLYKVDIIDKNSDIILFSFKYKEATEEEKEISQVEYEKEVQEYENKLKEVKSNSTDIFSMTNILFRPSENPLVSFVDWEINNEILIKYLTKLKDLHKILDNNYSEDKLLKLDKDYKKHGFSFSIFINSFKNKLNIETWEKFLNKKSTESSIIKGSVKIGEYDFQSDEPFDGYMSVEYVFYSKILEIIKDKLKWQDLEKDEKWDYSVLQNAFQSQWKYLVNKLSSINYLSNIREDNTRIYNATNNTPFLKLLKEYYELEVPDNQFLNKYLKAFEIGKEIKIEYLHNYQLINVSIITMNDSKLELVDFGYGIKQLIIILIQISVLSEKNKRLIESYDNGGDYAYYYYEPCTLLIEEPETNLHPKWQSLLGKLFVEANKEFNIQLIIETHSEYLIRKIQTLVAKNEISKEDIRIFYLRNPQNISPDKKQIETLTIEQDGSIDYSAFDKGFFDENDTLELSLLNIQRDTFIKEFEELKQNKDDNENKITELQTKIDDYTNKLDIGVYEQIINHRFNTTKLLPYSIRYLVSGQYLLSNINVSCDFSPVILQYGRAIENELKEIFIAIGITDIKKLMLGKFQGALEKFKTGTTIQSTFSNIELSPLPAELGNRFTNPTSLKIELLDNIRDIRNSSGHSGQTKTKPEAIAYIDKVNEFLDKWIDEKK